MSRYFYMRKLTKKSHRNLYLIEHAPPIEVEHGEVDDYLAEIVAAYFAASGFNVLQQSAYIFGLQAGLAGAQAHICRSRNAFGFPGLVNKNKHLV